MEALETLYLIQRTDWRAWLREHFNKKKEIWLVYPKKVTGKPRIQYNDAVEEALCFGWIDSTIKTIDEDHTAQRFTPKNPKSTYSQPNIERLKWLLREKMIHPTIQEHAENIVKKNFVFPKDIMLAIKANKEAWKYYQKFSDGYKRIRIAYIDEARKRPEEFQKRLTNFVDKTSQNKLIKGFGGIEKYY
jgi:uncharacterized protein YdeI (YjbR/CyaY-like superfamily)